MAKGKLKSGLQRYYEVVREAKKFGGEYAQYVDKYYKMSRHLRKKGVKTGQANEFGVLGYEDFMIDLNSETSNINTLIARQFGLISGNNARALKERLEEYGFTKVSLQRAAARQLSAREWQVIDEYYYDRKAKGDKPKKAQEEVAIYFFGS